jgi:hypothetical protein
LHCGNFQQRAHCFSNWAQTSQFPPLSLDTKHHNPCHYYPNIICSAKTFTRKYILCGTSSFHYFLPTESLNWMKNSWSKWHSIFAAVNIEVWPRTLVYDLDLFLGEGCQKMAKVNTWDIPSIDLLLSCLDFLLNIFLDDSRSSFKWKKVTNKNMNSLVYFSQISLLRWEVFNCVGAENMWERMQTHKLAQKKVKTHWFPWLFRISAPRRSIEVLRISSPCHTELCQCTWASSCFRMFSQYLIKINALSYHRTGNWFV